MRMSMVYAIQLAVSSARGAETQQYAHSHTLHQCAERSLFVVGATPHDPWRRPGRLACASACAVAVDGGGGGGAFNVTARLSVAAGRVVFAPARPGRARVAPACVDIDHWFGGSPPNFRTLELDHIDVDSADFWTNR